MLNFTRIMKKKTNYSYLKSDMIESRNSMDVLDPAFLYTLECFQSFHFSFGYANDTQKKLFIPAF
jgi:hypothetical protein